MRIGPFFFFIYLSTFKTYIEQLLAAIIYSADKNTRISRVDPCSAASEPLLGNYEFLKFLSFLKQK